MYVLRCYAFLRYTYTCTGTWSSFMCMLGLSNVLKTTMISLYPKGGNHVIEQMMNCTITPTEKSDLEKIVIMWTRGGAFNKSGPFDPNFVPLLPSTLTVTSESSLAASVSITQSKSLKQTKLSAFATNHIPQKKSLQNGNRQERQYCAS